MDNDLPPGSGPHEGRELELMLAGAKPLAMFNDDLPEGMEPPEIAFDPYVAEGRFVKAENFLPLAAFEDKGGCDAISMHCQAKSGGSNG